MLAATSWAYAQDYPSRPVAIIAPFAPGGSADVIGRLAAESLSKKFGGKFVVENRPGASGNIGHAEVARARSDGYTLLIAFSSTLTCNPALFSSINWNNKDFTPIGIFTNQPLVAVVNPSLGVDTITGFMDYVKANPGKISYGSSGVGSQAHLANIVFQQKTGTKMVHVPYKGTGDLLPDLLSGQIQMAFGLPTGLLASIKAGKLKAFAVAGTERDLSLPDVPTMTESGIDMVTEGWYALMAPAGTSPNIVATLAQGLQAITAEESFVERAHKAGVGIRFTGPNETTKRVSKELNECTDLVKSAGIKLD
jgi:tripartite-type tricarboxylate transporter receptor subunit TctC